MCEQACGFVDHEEQPVPVARIEPIRSMDTVSAHGVELNLTIICLRYPGLIRDSIVYPLMG